MEDRSLVAKTLLKCYPHLDDLYDSIVRSEDECVEGGFYAIFPNAQMRLYERIIAYEKRKAGVCNMKYLIEESFKRGRGVALSLLRERYLYKREMEELMQEFGVSLRTCYRYIKKGLADLASELEALGFDKKKIIVEYGNEPLFLSMLNRVIKEDDAETSARESEKGGINNRPLPLRFYCASAFSLGGRAQRG